MGSRLAGATHHLQWPPTPFWKALRVYLSYDLGEVDGRAAVRPFFLKFPVSPTTLKFNFVRHNLCCLLPMALALAGVFLAD